MGSSHTNSPKNQLRLSGGVPVILIPFSSSPPVLIAGGVILIGIVGWAIYESFSDGDEDPPQDKVIALYKAMPKGKSKSKPWRKAEDAFTFGFVPGHYESGDKTAYFSPQFFGAQIYEYHYGQGIIKVLIREKDLKKLGAKWSTFAYTTKSGKTILVPQVQIPQKSLLAFNNLTIARVWIYPRGVKEAQPWVWINGRGVVFKDPSIKPPGSK